MHLGGLSVDLGGSAPDGDAAVELVVLLEVADVLSDGLRELHLVGLRLHVLAAQALNELGEEHGGHRLDGVELVLDGVEVLVREHVRRLGRLVGADGEEVPATEDEVVEIRQGKKKITSRKFYPGYILINIEMDQDIWYLIKNTPKVTGFLGGGGNPVALSAAEIENIMEQMKGESSKPKPKFYFEIGENVRVVDGPFLNFSGVVDEVNPDKGKVKVMGSIFGRATPVELECPQDRTSVG